MSEQREAGLDRREAVRMAVGVATAEAFIARGVTSQVASAAPGQELVGSWVQTSEEDDVRTLLTFTTDSGVVATSTQHLDRRPSHGARVRIGDRTFLITMEDMTVSIDERNTLRETSTVRMEIIGDEGGQRYSWRGIRDDFDPHDELLRSTEANGRARRIVPRPLD